MNANEKNVFELFPSILDKYIENKIYEVINSLGIECSDYGTVVDTIEDGDGNTVYASVRMSDKQTIDRLVNHTGLNLLKGDVVKIYGSRTNASNRYIGVKCQNKNIMY